MESSAKVARVPIATPSVVGLRTTKTQGSATERQAADLICVPVPQYCSRPTESTVERGAPPDPSLHVHAPIFTLCKADNGRFYTADEYAMKVRTNREFRDAVFMGEFARQLEELGIEIEYRPFEQARQGKVSWEIKGSNPELRKFWSSNNQRAWEIRKAFEADNGRPMTDVELTRALYFGRRKKTAADKAQDSAPVWERWAADARKHGHRIRSFGLRPLGPITHEPYRNLRILHQRLMSANGLCRENAVFEASTIRSAVARCAVGLGFSPAELDGYAASLRAPENKQGLIPVRIANDPEQSLYTTRAVLAAEERIAQAASQKARGWSRPVRDSMVRFHVSRSKVKLDQEQIHGVYEICSGKRWVNITGHAGTGKTSLLRVAVDAQREEWAAAKAQREGQDLSDGGQIVVVSMAAATAQRTGHKLGADRYGSVESLLTQIEKGRWHPGRDDLFIVEEVGQMDTLRMDKLLRAVGNARVVLVGDAAQLTPIGAGGWYQDQLDKYGSVELTVVRRHQDPMDVADFGLIRTGRAEEALRNLADRGRVHISEDQPHRMAEVLADYRDFRNAGYLARDIRIIVDTSNHDIDVANRFVQRDRLSRGELREQGFEVHDVEQNRRWTIHEGDQVVFLDSYKRRFQEPIKNGSVGRVVGLDAQSGQARIEIDRADGSREIRRVDLKTDQYRQPVGLAYATHANRIQGAEVSIVQVMPGMGQTNANSAYSMVTRSMRETHVYAAKDLHGPDPIKTLGQAWSQREQKQSAHSKMQEIRQREKERTERAAEIAKSATDERFEQQRPGWQSLDWASRLERRLDGFGRGR
jgi:hypothetical protein